MNWIMANYGYSSVKLETMPVVQRRNHQSMDRVSAGGRLEMFKDVIGIALWDNHYHCVVREIESTEVKWLFWDYRANKKKSKGTAQIWWLYHYYKSSKSLREDPKVRMWTIEPNFIHTPILLPK